MLFQIYGDTALWQLLGWALVFTGLVLAAKSLPRYGDTAPFRSAAMSRSALPVATA